jgi:outer membrane protein assembly factor BamB
VADSPQRFPQVDPQVPTRLEISPGDGGASREFTISNDSAATLWFRGISRSPAVSIIPVECCLRAGQKQRIQVKLDSRAARGKSRHEIEFTWTALAPAAGSSPTETRSGRRTASVTVPDLPPVQQCPNAGCHALVRAGQAACTTCRSSLRTCPECGVVNLRAAITCSRGATHRLWPTGHGWTQFGGRARHGSVGAMPPGTDLSLVWQFTGVTAPLPEQWCSPVCAYEAVYIAGAAEDRARVVALAWESGALLWEADLPEGAAVYPDRGALTVGGGRVIAATIGGAVFAFDAFTGSSLWIDRVQYGCFAAPTLDQGRAIVPLTLGEDEGRVLVLDAPSGEELAKFATAGRMDSPGAIADDRLYIGADDGLMHCFALPPEAEPREVWAVPVAGGFNGGPVAEDDTLYVASTEGELVSLALGDGAVRWRLRLADAPLSTTPALSNGRLYVGGDDSRLHVVTTEGRLVHSLAVGGQVRSSPAVAGDAVLFGSDDGKFHVVSGRESAFVYDTGYGSPISASPLTVADRVVFASRNGSVYCMRLISRG